MAEDSLVRRKNDERFYLAHGGCIGPLRTILDSKRHVICFDERPCQLIGDAITPIPMKPGSRIKEHYEYSRNGTCCIVMAFEPRSGKRVPCVEKHRTKGRLSSFYERP